MLNINQEEEEDDLYEEVVLNYDEEKKKLFKHILTFIEDFSGHKDKTVFILMLKNVGKLS